MSTRGIATIFNAWAEGQPVGRELARRALLDAADKQERDQMMKMRGEAADRESTRFRDMHPIDVRTAGAQAGLGEEGLRRAKMTPEERATERGREATVEYGDAGASSLEAAFRRKNRGADITQEQTLATDPAYAARLAGFNTTLGRSANQTALEGAHLGRLVQSDPRLAGEMLPGIYDKVGGAARAAIAAENNRQAEQRRVIDEAATAGARLEGAAAESGMRRLPSQEGVEIAQNTAAEIIAQYSADPDLLKSEAALRIVTAEVQSFGVERARALMEARMLVEQAARPGVDKGPVMEQFHQIVTKFKLTRDEIEALGLEADATRSQIEERRRR
jgi:hypothetical protein